MTPVGVSASQAGPGNRECAPQTPTPTPTDVQHVDSLRLVRPRSVGVEQVGLWALEQLDLPALLTRLGVNGAPAQRGHRRHRRASGRARLGARDAPLAAGA